LWFEICRMLPGERSWITEIRDEPITLLIAGHETTATALAWAVEHVIRISQRGTPMTLRHMPIRHSDVLLVMPGEGGVGRRLPTAVQALNN
jgi:hypothetical protein